MLHVMEAAATGGMEHLLMAYLDSPHAVGDRVALTNRGASGPFAARLRAQAVPHARIDRFGSIALPERPKRLRMARARALARAAGPPVFWNHLPDRYTRTLCEIDGATYYDHGLAWHRPPDHERAIARFDQALACSRASARMLRLHWGFTGTITHCPNPSPIAHGDRQARAWQAGDDCFIIGVASRLTPTKGVGLAIAALAQLIERGARCRLLIAGTGPIDAVLRALADRLGVSRHIEWLGACDDMQAFYPRLHVLLHPTLHDAGSLVLREAAVFGCPVVATRIDGMPEWFADSPAGQLVAPSISKATYIQRFADGQDDLPPVCYDPAQDQVVAPMACAPSDLADALAHWYEAPALHAEAVVAARRLAASDAVSITRYTNTLAACLNGRSAAGATSR